MTFPTTLMSRRLVSFALRANVQHAHTPSFLFSSVLSWLPMPLLGSALRSYGDPMMSREPLMLGRWSMSKMAWDYLLRVRHMVCLYPSTGGQIMLNSLLAGLLYDTAALLESHTPYTDHNDTLRDQMWLDMDLDAGMVALDDADTARWGLPEGQRFPWDNSKSIYLLQAHHSLHCAVSTATFSAIASLADNSNSAPSTFLSWNIVKDFDRAEDIRISFIASIHYVPTHFVMQTILREGRAAIFITRERLAMGNTANVATLTSWITGLSNTRPASATTTKPKVTRIRRSRGLCGALREAHIGKKLTNTSWSTTIPQGVMVSFETGQWLREVRSFEVLTCGDHMKTYSLVLRRRNRGSQ